jgi:putative DNA primase/helicase
MDSHDELLNGFQEALHRVKAGIATLADRELPSLSTAAQPISTASSRAWLEPLPLVAKVEPENYPLDALPDIVREAVIEVQNFTKAPIPIVASSALASLSVAAQSYVDIKRAERLTGPTGLFLLTIADSGERKTTCDGYFSSPIGDHDLQQVELLKPEQKHHAAVFAAWSAERQGVVAAIKQAAKRGKPVNILRDNLAQLEERKPRPPKVPRLMRGDDTPENLAYVLANEWPTAGVITAEAGSVFGSHGMGTDSAVRNMALLNTLWDGGTHSVGRRTSESFTVRGARLTMGLQVQEATLRNFFDRSKGLARGIGFLARFLVSWPESTQGSRLFSDSPEAWPSLDAFYRCITEILNAPVPIDEEGALSPLMLSLSPDAKSVWMAFHDAIESGLGVGGELQDIRDVASKTADNCARLAALFHHFCSKSSSSMVAVKHMESASRIAAWHLNEARRFFNELAIPSELFNPARLDAWLLAYCRREKTHVVPTRKVQQFGPYGLRERALIEKVMKELEALDRSRLVKEGRNKFINVNPALLGG